MEETSEPTDADTPATAAPVAAGSGAAQNTISISPPVPRIGENKARALGESVKRLAETVGPIAQ